MLALGAFLVSFFVGITSLLWLGATNYVRLNRKSYPPISSGYILISAAVGATVLVAGVALTVVDTTTWPEWRENLFVMSLVFLPAAITMPAVAHLLPAREKSRSRARVVGFWASEWSHRLQRAFTWMGGLAGLFALLALFYDPSSALRLFQICGLLFASVASFGYMRSRAQSPPLDKVTFDDTRRPVLYLRSFAHESTPFAWIARKELPAYSGKPDTYPFGMPAAVTFEQYFRPELARQIGPFVALGNPEDALPPEGAARAYEPDSSWQNTFFSLAGKAGIIVMEVSTSRNVQFELASIKSLDWAQKLFVLTAPRPVMPARANLLNTISASVRTSVRGIHTPTWMEFAEHLRRTGYEVDFTDPGSGAVVCFDTAGRARVLLSGAVEPSQYVEAIKNQLAGV